jgi:hypothetical protein
MSAVLKITVDVGGTTLKATHPQPGAEHVVVELEACPNCRKAAPLRVLGRAKRIESHDTYAAEAIALCCGTTIGVVRVKVETLFGLDEDEAVLTDGRARVYGEGVRR